MPHVAQRKPANRNLCMTAPISLPEREHGTIRTAGAFLQEFARLQRAGTHAHIVDAARESVADGKRAVEDRRRLVPGASGRRCALIIDIELHSVGAGLRAIDDERHMVPVAADQRRKFRRAAV